METLKTLYYRDESRTEAKLEVLKWGEKYCPYIGTEVYSESKEVIFLTTEESIHAAQEVADAQYFTPVDIETWEDIRA